MKVYIISFKKEGVWNELMPFSKHRFKKLGYNVKVINGYNMKEHPEIKTNQIVYLNVRDKVLPQAKRDNNEEGFFIAEDDAFPKEFLTKDFLLERMKLEKYDYKNTILRIGYQKKLKQKGASYPLGYYLVGSQLTWIPSSLLDKLINHMNDKRPQHLNGYFSKLKPNELKIGILDEEEQKGKGNKYVDEFEHSSSILPGGKVRKGLKLNKTKVSVSPKN